MRLIVRFFLVTFLVTWTLFITAIALPNGTSADQAFAALRGLLVFAGTITPAFVALAITTSTEKLSWTKKPMSGLFKWRVDVRWYLFAISYMAIVKFAVAVVYRIGTGSWPPLRLGSLIAIPIAIAASTPFQAGEEIGWRGYALPQIAKRIGWRGGSVVLGIFWAFWHLPLFFLDVPGNDEYGQSFPIWALGVTALSVAIAWLYTHTRGSLLLTMLMHSTVNNIPHFAQSPVANARSVFALGNSRTAWLTSAFLWIAAAYFLSRMRHVKSADLSVQDGFSW